MIDINFTKVLGAWGANTLLGVVAYLTPAQANFDSWSKSFLTLAQIAVAVVTVVYITYKIRNERRK